jgi:hypothetical protein
MVQLYCDSCKKKVQKPSRGVNYVSELGFDLCLPCRDELLVETGKEVRRRGAYKLKDYHAVYARILRKKCS